MVDRMENICVQDLAFANALGISRDEVERLSLRKTKNKMISMAFQFNREHTDIDQKTADELNEKFDEIISALMEDEGYDPCGDYIINFNWFVPGNARYGKFAYC